FCTSPPTAETPFGVYWPTLVPVDAIREEVVLDDGRRLPVVPTALVKGLGAAGGGPSPAATGAPIAGGATPAAPVGPTRREPLGRLFGARSGDKGGNANVGVWARRESDWAWLRDHLTTERLRSLVPEAVGLEVRRSELPNLLAVNFVIVGLLGEGVAGSVRFDPQAKGLGEYLRSRLV
ncbi:MAG: exopolyphosphatase, partial [Alphaproteobacteria bacterium]